MAKMVKIAIQIDFCLTIYNIFFVLDPLSVKKIKQLYDDLNLPEVFKVHHKHAYDDIKKQIRIRLQSNEPLQKALLEILSCYFDRK